MAWQKCPVCNGLGRVNFSGDCTVCNGMKIINEVSGLPPIKLTNSIMQDIALKSFIEGNKNSITVTGNVINKNTDFRDNQEQFENK